MRKFEEAKQPARTVANQAKSSAANTGRRKFLTGAAIGAAAIPFVIGGAKPLQAAVQDKLFRHFRDIQRHENEHVAILESALGNQKRPKPTFKDLQTNDLDTFYALSQTFENVGVGAYLNALPAIADPAYVGAAGQIALIEARHAGFLNALLGDRVTANAFGRERAFELGLGAGQVQALAGPFVQSLNGGPPLTYHNQRDIEILNFALALEYLEQEFYNLNVPVFFGSDTSAAQEAGEE